MKRCEKDAIKEIKAICHFFGVDMIDMFKMFDIIDKDASQVNNIVAKMRRLVSMLLKKYNHWDVGLKLELEEKLANK